MSQVPHLDDWPRSTNVSITVTPPVDGYKRPVGFWPWPEVGATGPVHESAEAHDEWNRKIQEKERPKRKKKRKPSSQPSTGSGGNA